MKSGIYKIINNITEDTYIGSAENLNIRLKKHFYLLKNNRHHSKILQNAWNKYGEVSFEFQIIEFVEIDELIAREQHWMNILSPKYNVCPQAGSSKGYKHSEETKIKLSTLNSGVNNPSYGKSYNRKYSKKETIRNPKTNIKKIVRINSDGTILEYDSITQAAKDLGTKRLGGIQHVLKGRRKSYKGFLFRYKNEI